LGLHSMDLGMHRFMLALYISWAPQRMAAEVG
jgi:hypothetical protein